MSAELAASGTAPRTGTDKNAQAAEDAKKMLAELQGEATVKTDGADASEEKANGNVQEAQPAGEEENAEKLAKDKNEENESKAANDRRDRDSGHSSRGGREREGRPTRSYRDNIKSDLTTQEESNDPVAIRKQVLNDPCRAVMAWES
jgi:lupus La protein